MKRITANATHDDLTEQDYRDIYAELRTGRSLRQFIGLIDSQFSPARCITVAVKIGLLCHVSSAGFKITLNFDGAHGLAERRVLRLADRGVVIDEGLAEQ